LLDGLGRFGGGDRMIAYKFYMRDETNVYQLIGILPERRKNPERITPESVIHWGNEVLSDDVNPNNIFYITTTVDENTGEIYSSPSVF
jgi:predicted HAD superfamily hydrolase